MRRCSSTVRLDLGDRITSPIRCQLADGHRCVHTASFGRSNAYMTWTDGKYPLRPDEPRQEGERRRG